jgi:hypothetical protein
MRIDVPRAAVLYLLWIGFISGALLVGMADLLPVSLGSIDPSRVFTLLIEAELFFVLVIWPFFVPRLLKRDLTVDTAKLASVGGESPMLVLQVAVLFVVALPVALLSSTISSVSPGAFLRGHLLVAVMASFVAALLNATKGRNAGAVSGYFLGLFLLAAGGPFVHFLATEHFQAGSLRFLASMSPFWAAVHLEPGTSHASLPLVQSAVVAVATVVLLAAAPFLGKNVETNAART